ncbi:MAG: hypothetical protein M0P69_06430 [Bacteroidales bacterium]|nr:hypothetical protein [Bacteroidales bacterium]
MQTTPKLNEKGQPFQRLEERVFARYISDMVCGQAELSQITREVLPELAGEAKLMRVALTRIASALEKMNSVPAAPTTQQPINNDTTINLAVTDDVKIILAVRDVLFQASLLLEDKLPAPHLLTPKDLNSEELEELLRKHSETPSSSADTDDNINATNTSPSSCEFASLPQDVKNAAKIAPGSPRAQYVRDNYPPELYTKVASLFVLCEEKQDELGEPITKYMEMRRHLPRLPYYLYGSQRIWHGFYEFKAAFDAWAAAASAPASAAK